VFLTPPILDVKKWKKYEQGKGIRFSEVTWKTTRPPQMPFKYNEAPVLVWNNHPTDFPLVKQFALKADGRTLEGRLCSKIRSKAEPLERELAHQVVKVYEAKRAKAVKASPSAIAFTYDEALPWSPPIPDRNRKATYDIFHKHLHDETDVAESLLDTKAATSEDRTKSRCGPSRSRKPCCRVTRCN